MPSVSNIFVFVSPSGGPTEKNHKKNPLTPNIKTELLQKQYMGLPIHFVNMGQAQVTGKNAGPEGAVNLLKQCYTNAVMLVGGDRIGAFDWMGNIMNIDFEGISRSKGAMSATKLRKSATAKYQTRHQISTFQNAIKFGTVTPEHAEEIKQMIIEAHKKGGKKRKIIHKRQYKSKRKTNRKTKRKTKRKRRRKRRTKRRNTAYK